MAGSWPREQGTDKSGYVLPHLIFFLGASLTGTTDLGHRKEALLECVPGTYGGDVLARLFVRQHVTGGLLPPFLATARLASGTWRLARRRCWRSTRKASRMG